MKSDGLKKVMALTLPNDLCKCWEKTTTTPRRVSCRHFLVTPMSPKMASWPWLFLVNLGTSYGSINCARFATRESAGWIENRTIVKAPKTRNILIPKSMGKDWYVIFPSSSLSPHNGAIGKRPKNDKLRLQKAFLFFWTQSRELQSWKPQTFGKNRMFLVFVISL